MRAVAMSEKQKVFRENYKKNIADWYSGWGHLLSIFVPGICMIAYCVSQVSNVAAWELATILPLFLLYNFCEWWLHKNSMHKPIKHLKGALMPVFHRHTHEHHVYFTSKRMSYDTNKEWRIVLFPPYALLIFMTLTLPWAILLGFLSTANVGYLVMMITPIYYLNYETFHLCCHVKENWFVKFCPLINTIRRHHAAHHSQPIMMERNMNLTYPIADWAMGTSDLNRGLIGHLFNGYNTKYIKEDCVDDQGSELDLATPA